MSMRDYLAEQVYELDFALEGPGLSLADFIATPSLDLVPGDERIRAAYAYGRLDGVAVASDCTVAALLERHGVELAA